jgi:prolyl oligopeptidase
MRKKTKKTGPAHGLTRSLALACAVLPWIGSCSQPAPPAPAAPTASPGPAAETASSKETAFSYPAARKVDQVDDYHGTKVADPYRWLESLDAKDTREWVEAENRVTFGFLEKVPARQQLKDRLTTLWNFERYTPPSREGGRYFFSKNSGLQNQNVIYTTRSLSEEPQVLLDPNTLAKDGTMALGGLEVSDDGKLLAYGIASAGSDWQEWHVREIDTGKDRPDVVKWIKFSGASFSGDGKGFYYSRFAEPKPGAAALEGQNFYNKVYYHKLGTTQDKDELIYETPDHKEWMFSPQVTDDGRYLIITVSKGTDDKYRILYKDLKAKGKMVELINHFEDEYTFLDNDGPVFWFKTDRGAPRGKVIAIDTRKPDPKFWREILPQAQEKLERVSVVGDLFIASYLKDAYTQVKIFDLTGKPVKDVPLPGIGTAVGFGGKRKDKETFYAFTSYSRPATIYRLDLKTFASTVFKQPKLAFNPDDFETQQIFYKSKDGTRVPMFVTYKKGMQRDGRNPTLLYGYGGFSISLTPSFGVRDLVFMEMGGIYAVANLRGGGEYGEEWHKAGTRLTKQRVFDDFIAAAEHLIAEKYTSTPRLAIAGGSNGGLLVGACVTQRPDLFGAALPAVGVMDMLRFHKFTIGHHWVDDYGSSDNPEEFKALLAYSPLHNIKPGTSYPAMMITTADHDDRVVPGHSFKFAAAIQAAHKGPQPVLIRIETKAGHGAGKPTSKRIEEAADQLAFLTQVMQIQAPAAAAQGATAAKTATK